MRNRDRRGQNSHLLEIERKLMENQSKNRYYRSIDIENYHILVALSRPFQQVITCPDWLRNKNFRGGGYKIPPLRQKSPVFSFHFGGKMESNGLTQ
jgi:hypothetical protein